MGAVGAGRPAGRQAGRGQGAQALPSSQVFGTFFFCFCGGRVRDIGARLPLHTRAAKGVGHAWFTHSPSHRQGLQTLNPQCCSDPCPLLLQAPAPHQTPETTRNNLANPPNPPPHAAPRGTPLLRAPVGLQVSHEGD